MAQKFNWGAALTTLGGGIGDYAERQRRERTAALLRQQALDDEQRQREYDDQRWLERLNITDPLMPVPGDVRKYVGLPESSSFAVPVPGTAFGAPLGGPPIPTMARTSAVKNWQSMLPTPPKPGAPSITWKDPVTGTDVTTSYEDYLQYTRPEKETGTDRLMSFTYPTADWVDPAVRGRTVMVPASQYASLTNEFYGRYGGGGRPKDPKDVVAEWYGGEKQSGDFDPKTGTATPFSYPFRGSVFDPVTSPIDVIPDLTNAVRNEQAQGRGVATEQDARRLLDDVLGSYDVGLARQMDIDLGAQFQGWQPNTSGGKAIPGEYRKARGPWGFDNAPGPIRGATDWMVGDDIKSAAEFYADIVNKQMADNDTQDPASVQVEMRTINAWLKKKGLTLDQLAQYLKTSKDMGVDLPAAGAAVVNQRAAAADTSLSKY